MEAPAFLSTVENRFQASTISLPLSFIISLQIIDIPTESMVLSKTILLSASPHKPAKELYHGETVIS